MAVVLLLALGAGLAWLDHRLQLHTILVESVHALVVTGILILCLVCQYRYPQVRRFGWSKIIWGVAFLTIGSWVDILDDPPTLHLLQIGNIPFGRSWEQAFLKKILGYTVGFGLTTWGFFQWIPWMVTSRQTLQALNETLSGTNRRISQLMMSMDDHVDAERLRISRELHDDVAQQLTVLNVQTQLCTQAIGSSPPEALPMLADMRQTIADTLKSVRQMSHDLRPESLYTLGLRPAIEHFIETRQRYALSPGVKIRFQTDDGSATSLSSNSLETRLDDREKLHLFRVIQEGVHNAIRHGQALHINITWVETPDTLHIRIADDGKGLPWGTVPEDAVLIQNGHLGLVGMQERMAEVGGTLLLTAGTHGGAQLDIRVMR
jgi:signal transduction histidine kinase